MSEKKFEIKDLPVMPQVAGKILQMQEDNLEISFKKLENIILVDPALTAKILKVANSALYSRKREITNLQQAITLLGFKMIKSLVLLVSASNLYGKSASKLKIPDKFKDSQYTQKGMWSHLILTAFLARHIAVKFDMLEHKEDMFIAGLLHDIGRTVFYINDVERYAKFINKIATEKVEDILAVEEEIFGCHHAAAGKMVLQQWNFPEEYSDTVFQHHSEHIDSPHKKMITIVGLANQYAKIIKNESLSKKDEELKNSLANGLSISEDLDKSILENFMADMQDDELFMMSSSLQ